MAHGLSRRTIRIAGGGPAGLACAIVLADGGRPVEVHERRPLLGGRFDGDHQILPNFGDEPRAGELLDSVGLSSSDLEWTPLHRARFLDAQGRLRESESRDPFAFLIRRGPDVGSLDHALIERGATLGVDFLTDSRLDPGAADVYATGAPRYDGVALERMFRSSAPDRVDVLFDADLCPGGYAYLFIHGGEATMGVAALGGFRDLQPALDIAAERFSAVEGFNQIDPRNATHGMNFSPPSSALREGHPVVGEAAGFQDFLFGLGLRMALLSGRLAARALLHGEDYDRLWRAQLLPRMLTSQVDRWLYERAVRRSLFLDELCRGDLGEALDRLQRDHWGKRLLLPWVRWRHRRPERSAAPINERKGEA